ncbi:MAG: alpha/beta hydrolase [Pyrinomonadaceae bacterium]
MIRESYPQGKVHFLRHESEVLRGNPLGDPHEREVIVYTPPGYESGDDRLPVVYVLSGFTGRGRMMLNDSAFAPTFPERLDRLIAAGTIRPMIAVLPDCFTYYGGSQYINSTATGRYEDHLTAEIVPFVDENFRTLATRDARAVMGKSSGGYGALVMGMRHADVFGLVASISGDAYFEYCYLPDLPKAFRAIKGDAAALVEKMWNDEKKSKHDFPGLNVIGMSACYSPTLDGGFDLPFDLDTGELRPEVWQRWLAHDPVRMVKKYADALRSLRLLFLDAGTRDEFALDIGARILSERLGAHGVEHIREEFDDGHFNVSYRYDRALELVSRSFA